MVCYTLPPTLASMMVGERYCTSSFFNNALQQVFQQNNDIICTLLSSITQRMVLFISALSVAALSLTMSFYPWSYPPPHPTPVLSWPSWQENRDYLLVSSITQRMVLFMSGMDGPLTAPLHLRVPRMTPPHLTYRQTSGLP